MLKIFKYLKDELLSVGAIILLLIAQAYLDLTLPEYTSKIINVGVQQNGIENVAISQIGQKSLDKIFLFTSEKDKEYILANYEKATTYKNETIYKLRKKANEEKLANVLAKPMTLVNVFENKEIDINKLINLPNTDIFTVLENAPLEQRQDICVR